MDPVWALPVNPALFELGLEHDLIVTLEDGGVAGGLGSRLSQELRARGINTPLREFGVPQEFLEHGARGDLLEQQGLTAQAVARFATERISAAQPESIAPRLPR